MAKTNIKFNNKNFEIDESALADATARLEAHLISMMGGADPEPYVAGLYQTGAVALYNEQGAEAISGMLITPWDELVSSGAIVIDNGVVSAGAILPDNLPEKNEYGFYFDVLYEFLIFHEDGSCHMDEDVIPAGTIVYGVNSIDMSALDMGVAQVSDDGRTLIFADFTVRLGEQPNLDGDLFMSNSDNITEIGDKAFIGYSNLTNIIIPDGVTSIGDYAFNICDSLISITVPSSVTSIGDSAFSNCTSLTSIAIPDGVTSIGDYAFNNCYSLTSIAIPDGVTSIGDYAFNNCGLTNVTIPEGVTEIGDDAFCGCTNLTSITIPSSVTAISNQLVIDCTNLTSITFGGTVEQWEAFTLPFNWNYNVPATYVQCSDGQVALSTTT